MVEVLSMAVPIPGMGNRTKGETVTVKFLEDMSGITLIKIYAQEGNERRAFKQRNRKLLQANLDLVQTVRHWFLVVMTALSNSGM